NRGELVGGSTAPLYTLLLALVYRAIGDIVWGAKAVGIVFQCVTTVVVFKTMRILEPAKTYAQLTAALIVGMSPPLLWASLWGMGCPLGRSQHLHSPNSRLGSPDRSDGSWRSGHPP